MFDLKREHRLLTEPDEALLGKAPEDYNGLRAEIEKSIHTLQTHHLQLRRMFSPYLGKH